MVDRHGSDIVGLGMTDMVVMLWGWLGMTDTVVTMRSGSDTHSSDVALGMTDTAVML